MPPAHLGAISEGGPEYKRMQETCCQLGLRLLKWTLAMIDGPSEAHSLDRTFRRFKDMGK